MNPASGKQLVSSATFSFDSCAEQSHKDKSPDSQLLKPEAEDGIRDLWRSRGLGDVYKRQHTCQVRVTVGDSGLCCTCVTYFEH